MLHKFRSLLNKKEAPETEVKGYGDYNWLTPYPANSFVFATNNVKWMQYYSCVAPVADAVNKIADKASTIRLLLFAPDSKEAEMPVTEHPFLKLLNNPNEYQPSTDWKKEAVAHERICGNNYIMIVGGISAGKDRYISDPVEMYNLRPDFITSITPDPIDGRALFYQYTNPNGSIITFNRTKIKAMNGKYVDAYIDQNGTAELYVFKDISSRQTNGFYNLYGNSPLQAAEIQIGQYFEAAVYNYFLIVNGLSARKLISLDSKEIFTQSQKDSLKKFIDENFSGAVNSGKTLVSPIPLKVEDLQVALKDMDFKALDDRTTNVVYRSLNVPLPIVSNEHTSMNNMDVSTLIFFDDGVLPPLDKLCDRMFFFIFTRRYKDANQFLRLGYNQSSINALQPRIAQNTKIYKESGVCTINELREKLALSRVDSEGCDDIYMPGNMIAVGTDTNLRDTIGIDAPDTTDEKSRLEKIMRESKTADGKAMYSEESIRILLS